MRHTWVLVIALAAAGGIHLAVAPAHLNESLAHGGFFIAVAGLQLAQAALFALRPSRSLSFAIVTTNLLVLMVWAVSRTTGLPFGPDAGRPEPAGSHDLAAVLLETVVVVTAVRGIRRGGSLPRGRHAVVGLAVTVALAAAGLATAAPSRHRHATQEAIGHDARADDAHLHGIGEGFDPGPLRTGPIEGDRIVVGRLPGALAAGFGSIWVANRNDGTVTRIDAAGGRPIATIPVSGEPAGVAHGYGALWVASYGEDVVERIDPSTNRVSARVPVGRGPLGIATGAGGVWVSTITEGTVQRIDPRTLRASAPVHVGYGPTSLAIQGGVVWVTNTLDRTVVAIDGARMRTRPAQAVPAGDIGITVAYGRVWVTSASAGALSSLDPRSGTRIGSPITVDARTLPGQGPVAITAALGSLWVANNHDKTITEVDPLARTAGAPIFFGDRLGSSPTPMQIVAVGGALWVSDPDQNIVVRIDITNRSEK